MRCACVDRDKPSHHSSWDIGLLSLLFTDVSMHVAINNQCERSMVFVFTNKCYWSTPLLFVGVLMYVRIKCSTNIVGTLSMYLQSCFWHMVILGVRTIGVKEAWSISILTRVTRDVNYLCMYTYTCWINLLPILLPC